MPANRATGKLTKCRSINLSNNATRWISVTQIFKHIGHKIPLESQMGIPTKMGFDYAQELLQRVSYTLSTEIVYSYSLSALCRLFWLRDNLCSTDKFIIP